MSVWSSINEVKTKQYVHSGYDPRKKADGDGIDLALVADYVYNDAGNGDKVLPYLRLTVGQESTLLTENQAQNLIIELHDFIERPKYRGKPKSEE
jgi:hypothetical protein